MNKQDKGKGFVPRLLSVLQMSPMYLEGKDRHRDLENISQSSVSVSMFVCVCACLTS